MECPRCQGLMVQDVCEDLRDETGALTFHCWRCIQCGEILDPGILANRASHPVSRASRARKTFALQLS